MILLHCRGNQADGEMQYSGLNNNDIILDEIENKNIFLGWPSFATVLKTMPQKSFRTDTILYIFLDKSLIAIMTPVWPSARSIKKQFTIQKETFRLMSFWEKPL